ncbi:frizzled-5-like [Crassostrea angulata]|uniref:frizzled-5-like n=1 Tax=Magallana angulata TaxID=2784310 RepID=UPI0022B175F0|nr:frizzled-5-like [Crassostrea angulata]
MAVHKTCVDCLFLVLTFTVCLYVNICSVGTEEERRCQEITIPMCKGIEYNLTHMPNQFHHKTQEESGLEVHQFWPLVEIYCSPDLQLFLCSMYAPNCIPDYKYPLPACRSVCERAKYGCAPLMALYGFEWPERMKCENLPVFGSGQLCMDHNQTETTASPTKKVHQVKPKEPNHPNIHKPKTNQNQKEPIPLPRPYDPTDQNHVIHPVQL